MKSERYVVVYISYKLAKFSDDNSEGWNDYYSVEVFSDEISALEFLNDLKKDKFTKNQFISKEIKQ